MSLDWSNARPIWQAPDPKDSTCEAVSTANCRAIKALNPQTRCFIYHNTELALEWLESQRAVMTPSNAPWFLRWPNGSIYDTRIDCGSQYYWDLRNSVTADYFVASIIDSLHWGVDGRVARNVT